MTTTVIPAATAAASGLITLNPGDVIKVYCKPALTKISESVRLEYTDDGGSNYYPFNDSEYHGLVLSMTTNQQLMNNPTPDPVYLRLVKSVTVESTGVYYG